MQGRGMFYLATLIGIYSYLIFFLGVQGILYKNLIISSSIIFWLLGLLIFIKNKSMKFDIKKLRVSNTSKFLVILIILQTLINLIGVLGPEISFDALWYHLTIPEIYLENHSIFYIDGGLLYYSAIPKLTEMLYVTGLSLGSEIFPKLTHFLFSVLLLFCIYRLSRKFVSIKYSLLAVVIFYSNLLVGWESITSYVDLTRTFFELLSFFALVVYLEKRKQNWLFLSAVLLGFAITVKLSAIFSVLIFIFMIFYTESKEKYRLKAFFKKIFTFVLICLLIPLPWFIFSYLNTGNPIYPYFSIPVDSGRFISIPGAYNLRTLFLNLNDPISPIYLILLPVVILFLKKFNTSERVIIIYSFLAFIVWFFSQEQRGGRFLLPYLPVFSILSSITIQKIRRKDLKSYIIFVVILISLISIFYRGFANAKFIPYILGNQSKSEFLASNLNFSFGDFYDTDEYFKKNIKSSDKVLLYGFHNLYYVDFSYIDSSWVKEGDRFNYIATQNTNLPTQFADWTRVYYNKTTKVGLYSMKGKMWAY